jgi:hypothetical protein
MLNLNINKKEAVDMFEDIIKFLTVIFIIHVLLFAVDDQGDLLSEFSLKILLYVTIALIIYHLIIRKIIVKLTRKNKK